jgi:predicted dehydrogenase
MAMNTVEAQQMVDAQQKSKKKLMIAHHFRFRNDVKILKAAIENGDLGTLYHARVQYLRRNGIPGIGSWFTTKALSGGGALIDIGVHILDMSLHLLGFPEIHSVSGTTGTYFGNRPTIKSWGKPISDGTFDVDDFASGFIKFKNGCTLYMETCWASHSKEDDKADFQMMGTEGGATLWPLAIYVDKYGAPLDITPKYKENQPHEDEVAHFVECIRTGQDPIPNGKQVINVIKVIDAIYKSGRTGKEVLFS